MWYCWQGRDVKTRLSYCNIQTNFASEPCKTERETAHTVTRKTSEKTEKKKNDENEEVQTHLRQGRKEDGKENEQWEDEEGKLCQ